MIKLQKQGLVKSIGVCNFQIHHLQKLIDETGDPR
jgi:2,5-diketo-D-gluconate reductase A